MAASVHPAQPPGAQGLSRSDARRNRQRLLDAAALAFNAEGAGASLDDIARAAGVGNATLYRHFPTRQVLITAVYDDRFRGLCAAAEEFRTTRPALEALTTWLRLVIDHITGNCGLRDAFIAAHRIDADEQTPELVEWHHLIHATAQPLLGDAQSAGHIRPDLAADELLALTTAVARAYNGEPPRADRLLSLILEGIQR
ncbi:TetR/AcrR family transcriptional regulator [Streptomyces scopuliridis]|uniref:TetR/AcrR family transcriptional regulator n=1 Tax=Streptomyces scopuliridis TaxID=452529 RepID=UPI0036845DED